MRRLDDAMRTREDSFETDLKALYEASNLSSFLNCLLAPLQSSANFRLETCCFSTGLRISEETFRLTHGKEAQWRGEKSRDSPDGWLMVMLKRPRWRLGNWNEVASQERKCRENILWHIQQVEATYGKEERWYWIPWIWVSHASCYQHQATIRFCQGLRQRALNQHVRSPSRLCHVGFRSR